MEERGNTTHKPLVKLMKDLQARQATLINLITRVGGKQNIQKWMDELLEIDWKLTEKQEQEQEENEMETANYTHIIWCEMEQEWIEKLAAIWDCTFKEGALLLTEDQFNKVKNLSYGKLKAYGKKIGFDYDNCHIVECLNFEGKILTAEEKAAKEKKAAIANMNGDDLCAFINELNLKKVCVMKASGGSSVVEIHLQSNTDVEQIQQLLFDECIPYSFSPSGKIIECSGKLSRIKDEYERKLKENANQPWFKKDRSRSDSF